MEQKIDELQREMNEQERTQNEQNEYLNSIIIDINNFYSNPNYEMFNKLLPKSQKMIISNIKKKESKENEQIDNIYTLVNYLWEIQLKSKHQFDNNQLIYIETRDNKRQFSSSERIEKIVIPTSMIEILITNSSKYEPEFVNIINKFENIYVYIEYPSTKYQQIIDSIIKVKKTEEFKLKTEIRIIKIESGENPFQHNEYIDSITIEPSNKIIPREYCKSYTSLTKAIIPNSVTTIGGGAFCECSSLREIILPTTITFISDYLFQNCSSLKSIIIPPSVTSIGNYSFSGCSSLTQITIPSTVESIGENCFEGCTGLKQVIIDLFHTNIKKNTFRNCPPLKEIISVNSCIENNQTTSEKLTISSNQTEVLFKLEIFETSYFSTQISEIEEINIEIKYPTKSFPIIYQNINKLKKSQQNRIKICIFISEIETTDQQFRKNKDIDMIKFDSNIKNIKSEDNHGSFENCSRLAQITIPSSVTSIEDSAFNSCSRLA